MNPTTGIKIKKIREYKNLTQDYMAEKLGMSQHNYSRLENGQSKLDTERLKEISKLLEVPAEVILSDESHTFNFNNSHSVYSGYIVNLQEENRELNQNTIKLLQEQIALLHKENERLLKLVDKSR